jgi:hypothetical protein
MPGDDTLEVILRQASKHSVCITGHSVVEVKWRNPSGGPCRKYQHTCDLSALEKRSGSNDVIRVADDDGKVLTLSMSTFTLAPAPAAYGEHASIPCGVAALRDSGLVLTAGMEGTGKVWREATGELVESDDLCDSCWRGNANTPQMANPPIPTCVDVAADGILVGRGDGTYAVGHLPPAETLAAVAASASPATGLFDNLIFTPAHAGNGLASVSWCSPAHNNMVLTAAVSGEVMMWSTAMEFSSSEAERRMTSRACSRSTCVRTSRCAVRWLSCLAST